MSSIESQLALLGGRPLRDKPAHIYNTIGDAEKKAAMAVLDSGELSGFVAGPFDSFWGGKSVRALEQEFCKVYGTKYAVAVNSATSGLHCALNAMGLGPGDEVITTPLTMSATSATILMTGAVPVFADIEEQTFCLDPKQVEEKISPYTKGIVAVNIFGHPANYDALKIIADKYNLFIIEDNAQAPHALYKGKYTGAIGDVGVFSFNRHKTMQAGEGGVLITNNETIAFKAACFRNHGELAVKELGHNDFVNTLGINYRMTEINAAISLCQFKKIKELTEPRINLASQLTKGLNEVEGIVTPMLAEDCKHVYYFYVMKYNESEIGIPRDLFCKAVMAEGFYLRGGYVEPLLHQEVFQRQICFGSEGFPFSANKRQDALNYKVGSCPVAERVHSKDIILTNIIFEPYTVEDMDLFVKSFKKVIMNKDELLKMA
jgi:perosamine synthetase